MEAFIKIGEELINIALVIDVKFSDEPAVTLTLIDPRQGGTRSHTFQGEEVVSAFRTWLTGNTYEIPSKAAHEEPPAVGVEPMKRESSWYAER